MGGIAMKKMLQQIEEKKGREEWINYDVHETGDPNIRTLPIRWWQTEKGTTSTVFIGLPQISKSVQPKPRRRWIPISPVKCMAPTMIQVGELPISLNWNSKSMEERFETEIGERIEWKEREERTEDMQDKMSNVEKMEKGIDEEERVGPAQ